MVNLDRLNQAIDAYRSLMPHRVREILLVASVYDAYILEEDGSLEEGIWDQYMERGLSSVPRVRKVHQLDAALEVIRNEPIDLVLTILHDESTLALELARQSKEAKPDLPVIFLVTDPAMLATLPESTTNLVDRLFLWDNDPALLLAIVKLLEDRLNVDHDTQAAKVRVLLMVEDSVAHYSSFLPLMYTAIMKLTRQLMDDGLNHMHKQERMRSRTKVLLVDTYDEAMALYNRYRHNLLGVVTDVRFWKDGELNNDAGFDLIHEMRKGLPELPVCVQSSQVSRNRGRAVELDAHFLDKNSPHLLDQLERWLMEDLGFGDFVFRDDQWREVDRASTPHDLIRCLTSVPIDVVIRHARQQDFSHWMMARTEIQIAEKLSPKRVEDFPSAEDVRAHLIHIIKTALHEKQADVITHYSIRKNPYELEFMRLGDGSLGGKARGIGFLRYLLSRLEVRRDFPEISLVIPPTLVVCSDLFLEFMEDNHLWSVALSGERSFADLLTRFQKAPVRSELTAALSAFLRHVQEPLAVRSSSLMEDSRHLPLAGLYATIMLRNNETSHARRLAALLAAIKRVWASMFDEDARAYFRQTGYRQKDERMSVVLQPVAGTRHGRYVYPTFSGVAQSYNFYPVSYMKPEDGVAQLALGLGKTVVEGGPIVRFCPKYPQILPQFADIRSWLYFTQKHFYALDLEAAHDHGNTLSEDGDLQRLELDLAERHGVLQHVASVYQSDSNLLVDSFFNEGPRIVTFMKVLRDGRLRLGELLGRLLSYAEEAMHTPVEMEFAVDLRYRAKPVVTPLQLRPMASKQRWERVSLDDDRKRQAVCYSNQVHGNGTPQGIQDILYVRRDRFEKSQTREIAQEIGQLNKKLVDQGRPYLLIGYGRWGSTDPDMGIGVRWSQISGVKVMVEVGLPQFNVDPAQGTHFFQNVTSLNIGCLSVPHGSESFLTWDWLENLPTVEETTYCRHLRLEQPLDIRLDGRVGEAVIVDPAYRRD